MGIRRGDASLGMQLVHSKRSINGTHFAKVLTNSVNSPDPHQIPRLGGAAVSGLCSMSSAVLPHPQVRTPKPGPIRCTEAPFSARVPSAAPGGPCLVTPRTRRLHGQRGAFCSRRAREAPALIRLITVHMAAGRALAQRFPTAAKKAPQCGAENRAAIQLRPPAPRAPRPPLPCLLLWSSDSACRVPGAASPAAALSHAFPPCPCVCLPVPCLLPPSLPVCPL